MYYKFLRIPSLLAVATSTSKAPFIAFDSIPCILLAAVETTEFTFPMVWCTTLLLAVLPRPAPTPKGMESVSFLVAESWSDNLQCQHNEKNYLVYLKTLNCYSGNYVAQYKNLANKGGTLAIFVKSTEQESIIWALTLSVPVVLLNSPNLSPYFSSNNL